VALKIVVGFIVELIPDGTSTSVTVNLKTGPVWTVITGISDASMVNGNGSGYGIAKTFEFAQLLPALSVTEVNFNGATASLSADGKSITFTWATAPLGSLVMQGKLEVSS
jgi:hypothetical protein